MQVPRPRPEPALLTSAPDSGPPCAPQARLPAASGKNGTFRKPSPAPACAAAPSLWAGAARLGAWARGRDGKEPPPATPGSPRGGRWPLLSCVGLKACSPEPRLGNSVAAQREDAQSLLSLGGSLAPSSPALGSGSAWPGRERHHSWRGRGGELGRLPLRLNTCLTSNPSALLVWAPSRSPPTMSLSTSLLTPPPPIRPGASPTPRSLQQWG